MGTDPNSPDNRWLLDAMEQQIPVIYFLGASPGRYQPIIPSFIQVCHLPRLENPVVRVDQREALTAKLEPTREIGGIQHPAS
jgi:hypothetical protein